MDEVQFKPLGNRVLVLPGDAAKTKSGLMLPTEQATVLQGKAVAVGPGYPERMIAGTGEPIASMNVKVGDTVAYCKHDAQPITVAGTDYLLITEDKLLGLF